MLRRHFLQLAVLSAAGLTGRFAHAGYNVWTGEFTVPATDLTTQIQRRFPVRLRYADIFTLQLNNPVLALDAERNRVMVTADLQVSNPLFLPQPVQGLLAISSGLVFDAATRALRLREPRTERLQLQGLSDRDARRLNEVGGLVAREVLNNYALHIFAPEDLRLGLKTLEPGDITVLADGVKIQLH